MDKSGKGWVLLNTVMKIRILNKIILRRDISFPRRRNPTKTTCITKRVSLQLYSPLRHRKYLSLYKWPRVPFLYFSTYQVLILTLCSVGINTRDVRTKQIYGSLPITWSVVGSRYQHNACCVEHCLAVAIIMFSVTMQNFGIWQRWLNKFEQKRKWCFFSSTWRREWLRHCTTSRKEAGFIGGVSLKFFIY